MGVPKQTCAHPYFFTLNAMADRMTQAQRHYCMSRIRSRNTKPELIVRKHLFSHGYRYRINQKRLPGSPDIVLKKYKTIIFINGCFWHGHEGCKHYVLPKSNTEFWKNKINRNKERDTRQRTLLRKLGWHIIIIWECQLLPSSKKQTLESLDRTLNKIYLDDMSIKKNDVKSNNSAMPKSYIMNEENTQEDINLVAEEKCKYGRKQ
jgi:DNA mismatch endonuclease (patch repair protein)